MKTIFTLPLFLFFFSFGILFSSTEIVAQAPANDHILNATNLNLGPSPYALANVLFSEATIDGDQGAIGCGTNVAGIWFKFSATSNGTVTANIQTPAGSIITFYTAPSASVNLASELTYIDVPSNPCGLSNFSTIDVTAGSYYYLFMRNGMTSSIAINVDDAFAAPENDHISQATLVALDNAPNVYNNIHFLMADNFSDGGQAGCDTDEIPGIWYKFYSEVAINVDATLSSSANASTIIFYLSNYTDAANTDDLEHVDQPGNLCGIQNTASIVTEADSWYYIFASTLEPYANVTIDASVLGTAENTLEGFSFYPNPISNEINLNAKSTIDKVSIFNLLGQTVASEKIGTTHRSLDLSYLQTGLYIMKVTSEGKTGSYKIVKK